MRLRRMAWAAAVALAATATVAATAQGAAPAQRALTRTTAVVVRPVSWTGEVTPGYGVTRQRGSVDCSFDFASPAAVDPDILECSPSAANGAACWLSRVPHRTLCLLDPRSKHVFSVRRQGVMAQALPHVAAKRGALGLRLADGTYCSIRINGAANPLKGHPRYALTYYCTHGQGVWAAPGSPWGINRSHPVWTVRTAPADGQGSLRTRDVAEAWFAGMHT